MKKKSMLITVIIMLIAIVSIYGVIEWKEYQTTEIVEEIETKVCELSLDQIARFEIYNEDTLGFIKKDNVWIEEALPELVYEQDKIEMMVKDIAEMTAFEKITNIQDLSSYGITEKAQIITVYDHENNAYTIRIGNKVSGQDAFYIWSDTDEAIYLVPYTSLANVFLNRQDTIDKDMNMPNIEEINQVIITEGNKKISFVRNTEEGMPGFETWLVKDAYKTIHQGETEKIEQYMMALEEFTKDKFVTESTEDISQFGLDAPSLIIEINGKYTIKFGNTDGDYTYFKYSGEPHIYKMLTEKVKIFKQIDGFSLINKQIYKPQLEQIESITLQQGEQIIEWEINNNQSEEARSHIGEKALSEEQTNILIDTLASINIYKPLVNPEVEEKQERTAEVVITYNLVDGSEKKLEFIPYDPSIYILRYDGHTEFSADKKPIVMFFNQLNVALK